MNIRPQNVERYNKAEKMFIEKKTIREISKTLKMDAKSISSYLKFKGHTVKAKSTPVKADDDLVSSIEMYEKGMNVRKIAKALSVGDNRVRSYLIKNGIQLNVNNQLYTHNTSVFKKIDTEEKAYWLGFLGADGANCKNILELTLKESDKAHVEQFRNFISPTAPVTYRPTQKAYRVAVCSKEICDDLSRLGITPSKSLTYEFCEDVPEHLLHHYLRGYFDGDGSVHIRKDNQAVCEIIGTESFLNQMLSKLDLHINKKGRHGKAFYVRYSGNQKALVFLDKIYKDATIYLPRKFERYQKIVQHCRPQGKLGGG